MKHNMILFFLIKVTITFIQKKMKDYRGSVLAKIQDKTRKYSKISGWPPKIITKAAQRPKWCAFILAHLLTKLKTKESNLERLLTMSPTRLYIYTPINSSQVMANK